MKIHLNMKKSKKLLIGPKYEISKILENSIGNLKFKKSPNLA